MQAHQPVMLAEVLAGLALRDDGLYVDCTFGRGGHSEALLGRLGEAGRVIAIDRDPEAVAAGERLAAGDRRFEILHGRFESLGSLLAGRAPADGVLFDLGLSSPQLADAGRGFSFAHDGPLDMRMDTSAGETAAEWLNRAPEREIADTLYQYGDERRSRRIARAICAARPLERTAELARLVRRAYPPGRHRIDPATRTFQALRIRVNEELHGLADALEQALALLRIGGRLAVISFHSLEDRIVKHFMREHKGGRLGIVERLQRPGAEERAGNPRARSARLRVAEKLA